MTTATADELKTELWCRPLCAVGADLGEGLLWDARRQRLLMTDILKGQLLELDIDAASVRSWTLDEPLAWVLMTRRLGIYALGLRSGIALWDVARPSSWQWVNRDFPGPPPLRLNDACADAHGRVWYGSMNSADPQARDGRLASFLPSEGLRIHDDLFTVTNGPVVSANGRYLFFNDTLRGAVYRYRLSSDGASVMDREVFAQFEAEQGFPDGMCLDSQGHLWVALWGAAAVVELDTEGQVLRRVAVPAKNVTNVCFAGPELNRLIVSSAAIDMSPDEHRRYPHAGDVFEVMHHDRKGLPTHFASLDGSWI